MQFHGVNVSDVLEFTFNGSLSLENIEISMKASDINVDSVNIIDIVLCIDEDSFSVEYNRFNEECVSIEKYYTIYYKFIQDFMHD